MTHAMALPNGTVLASDYRIERVLGAGGFGITYLADEMALQRLVTIKEYFPSDFAARADDLGAVPRSVNARGDYQWGLDRFIEEAQTLAKFDHRNIVKVYRYFRANNTGYMVLHFEEGQSLKGWLKSLGRAPRQRDLDPLIAPLLEALEVVHDADFLHRDIAPDNIIVRKDGSPVLIDFGSARGEIAKHSRTLSALVKPGYSPYEQYSETGHRQGPWTDIYALGATLYHAISGKRPPDAPSRVIKDEYVPAREVALSSYRANFLRAIDRALALEPERRPQSIKAWRGDLLAPDPKDARAGGWIGRRGAEPVGADAAATPGAAGLALPPVPDAPGPQGRFLDFVEALKQGDPKAAPAGLPGGLAETPLAASAAAPSPPVVSRTVEVEPIGPAAAPARAEVAPARASVAAKARSNPPQGAAPVVVARPEPIPPPRPRPVRRGGPRWRSLAMKLLIGAGIASLAVAYQDKLPFVEVRGQSVPTSQTGDVLLQGTIRGHAGGTVAVAYTEDGRSIVTAGADGTLKVWSASAGTLWRTVALEAGPVTSLALSGRRAATGHKDGLVALWDLDRGERLAALRANEASIWSVAFAGAPTRLLASGHDWSVTLWDTRNPTRPLHVFEGHENAAQAVAFAAAGSFAASGGADRTVRLWSTQSLSAVRTYRGHRDFVTAVAFAPDGRLLASASLDGQIRLWSTASSSVRRTLAGHRGRVSSLAFSPTGDLIASAGDDGAVRLWDFRRDRERPVRTLGGGGATIRSLAFQPDGKRIAAAADDGTVRLWAAELPSARRSAAADD